MNDNNPPDTERPAADPAVPMGLSITAVRGGALLLVAVQGCAEIRILLPEKALPQIIRGLEQASTLAKSGILIADKMPGDNGLS